MRSSSGCAANWRASSRHQTAWTRPSGWSGVGSAPQGRRRGGWAAAAARAGVGRVARPPVRATADRSSSGGKLGAGLRTRRPRLALAGDNELWVVDVAAGTVRHRTLPQLSPGDPPYRIVRRGDKLVLWSYQTLTLDPSSADAQPSVLVRDSWIFIPSAAPNRIWVGILDPTSPETERRLKAVREVTVDGRVTVADVRPPQGRWPVAATRSALAFQSQGGDQLELWEPPDRQGPTAPAGRLPDRLTRRTCSHGAVNRVRSCRSPTWRQARRSKSVHPPAPPVSRPSKGCSRRTEAARGSRPCRVDMAAGVGGCGRGNGDASQGGRGAARLCLCRLVYLGYIGVPRRRGAGQPADPRVPVGQRQRAAPPRQGRRLLRHGRHIAGCQGGPQPTNRTATAPLDQPHQHLTHSSGRRSGRRAHG